MALASPGRRRLRALSALLATGAALIAVPASAQAATNLLTNGDFSQGLSGWQASCRSDTAGPCWQASPAGLHLTTTSTADPTSSSSADLWQQVPGDTDVVLRGTATVNRLEGCAGVSVLVGGENAYGGDEGTAYLYAFPPNACPFGNPLPGASDNAFDEYHQPASTWTTGAGPQSFAIDLRSLLAEHKLRFDPTSVKAITVEIRTTSSNAGTADVTFSDLRLTSTHDTLPPTTDASVDPAPNAAGWNSGDAAVHLDASDDDGGSGVKSITYSVDGAPTTTVPGASTSFVVSQEGEHTVTYHARDVAGNDEADRTLTVRVDKTAPTSAATLSPEANAAGWVNRDSSVRLDAADATPGSGVVGIVYRAEGSESVGETTADGSSATLPVTHEGDTTVTYHAVDRAGNVGAEHTVTVHLDRTPPTVAYTGDAGAYTVDQDVSIACAASDALSGVASSTCRDVSGAAYTFALGRNAFSAQATDRAGNTGSGEAQFTVAVTPDSLCRLTRRFAGGGTVADGLCAKLAAAQRADARGDAAAKAGALRAYANQVDAQSAKALTAGQAGVLGRLAGAL